MSIMIFAGQRVTYKWFHFSCEKLFYGQGITRLRIRNTAQYCISVKDKDKNIFKDYENIASKTNVQQSSKFNDITRKVSDLTGTTYDKLNQKIRLDQDSIIQKKLERLYPDVKSAIKNIYAVVSHDLNDKTVSNLKYTQIKKQLWQATLDVKWPEVMSFTAVSRTKTVASKNVALKCLSWLEMNGKLRNGKPIIYTAEEIKEKQLKPIELSVSPQILAEMVETIEKYNTIPDMTESQEDSAPSVSNSMFRSFTPVHPILGKPFTDAGDVQNRNEILKNRVLERQAQNTNVTLPIFEYRDKILSKLQDNRVLLIEGDTGCGKTTQVPQFIMDSFTQAGNATDCNILVSQPRRISAISLANRIAYERDEMVGDVVGFHVRLEQSLPSDLGGILFCTTGILLKKLQSNPNLLGCSHVILDEAHERNIDIDMLMILLKRALQLNSGLHVLIMSATINARLFQEYFDCPSVKVPGRLYPVEMHFMEDIERLPNLWRHQVANYSRKYDRSELTVDTWKLAQIIMWISENKPPGAILCFLPGWGEISNLQDTLQNHLPNTDNFLILPIHSKMAYNEQSKIFQHTSRHMRKIILATDIAETGITVSDVVYVVDSAISKNLRWDENKSLPRISNCWVSRANIEQRKGRAGRVKPGESYHLIRRAQYKNLESHPMPEILCNSLEKVVLDSKTYTNEKAEEFLSGLIQPPSPLAIRKAIDYLIDLGVVDDQENLTVLGKRLALFPMHPKISKALVYSTIFNCMYPVTTIASIFSGEDNLFSTLLNDKPTIRKNKRLFHPSSDHIALAWIFKQWIMHNADHDQMSIMKFCKNMKLRYNRMEILRQIRDTFTQQLIQCRMLSNQMTLDMYNDFDIPLNKYENEDELIRALLYSATQQLIEHKKIGFKNGVPRKMNCLQTRGRARAMISGESVNHNRKQWPSPLMTYFHSAHCETRRSTVIRETSMISPLSALLFSEGETRYSKLDDDNVGIAIRCNSQQILRFSCDERTADVLLRFKDIMWSLVQFSLERQGINDTDPITEQMFQYKDMFLDTLSKTLGEAAKCIESENNNDDEDETEDEDSI